jgi:hypothetical protein
MIDIIIKSLRILDWTVWTIIKLAFSLSKLLMDCLLSLSFFSIYAYLQYTSQVLYSLSSDPLQTVQ